MTFDELDRASNQFANALIEAGLSKGDRISVMCPNIPEYGVIHFGAARTGCVQAHLSVMYGPEEITRILNQTGARLIVVDEEFLPAIDAVRRGLMLGQGLANPMAMHSIFPPLFLQMVRVGEETNTLETNLKVLSDFTGLT